MDTRIGTCSECGGAVVVPPMMVHPTPHCIRCGAIARHPHGPVIPMEPVHPVPLPDWRESSVNLRPRMPRPAHLTYVDDESDLEPGLRGTGTTNLDWD